jgi:tetratricopeptide (TPR) repeat protein
MSAQPGRNEPCFCGSGKKFKHCHGSLPGGPARPALDPREIGALVGLVDEGKLSTAEAAARSALSVEPQAGILWKILSVALLRQGKDALPALQRAAELLPRDAEALHNLGAALYDRGQWKAALDYLRQALAVKPDHLNALVDAANALRELRQAREAVPLYQRALSLSPRLVEAQNNLGNALLELGEHAEAVNCYQRALDLKPGDVQIVCNLANALRQLGRLDEAADLTQQAVALGPALGIAHNARGLALVALGRRAEAVASYRQALQLNPEYVEALNNLGDVLRDLGERRSAVPLYRQAVELQPGQAEHHCNLGNVLFELRRVDEAIASFQQALSLRPDYAPAHLSLALALRQQRRPTDAEVSCQAALAINPDYVEAVSFLGELRADRGRFVEAERLFNRAIELNPDFSFALTNIATHRKMTSEDTQWLERAEALLARPLPLGHEISLRYALGKYSDDLGRYDTAFAHYCEANELTKRYGIKHDRARLSQRIDDIIASSRAWLSPDNLHGASDSEVPVLIVGMPRSGTSLAEQILASHPAVFGAGEVSFWNSAFDAYRKAELEGKSPADLISQLAKDYLRQLDSQSRGAPRIVDKMPANFMYVGLIHAAFRRARIIHMRRHPIDTCLSVYFQNFFNIGPYANDLEDLAHYYQEYARVSDHWRAVVPATALLEVPYEELVADQQTWTRRMLDFIGVPWDPKCLDFHDTERVVITASRWQVRQRINASSAGRWRHYEKYIGPLRQLIESPGES